MSAGHPSEFPAKQPQPAKGPHDEDAGASKATEAVSPGMAPTDASEKVGLGLDSLPQLLRQFQELGAQCARYAAAKTDGFKLLVRDGTLRIVLSAAAFVAICGVIIVASCLLLSGIAGGIGVLCGQQPWIGNIAAGFLALVVVAVCGSYAIARRNRIHREETVRRYEARETQQRMRFGHDATGGPAADAADRK